MRVATANLQLGNSRPADAARRLGGLDLDLLLVLEWTGSNLDLEAMRRRSLVPVLDAPHPGTHGILVLVRASMDVTAAVVPSPVEGPCAMPLAAVRIPHPETSFSVLGVHPPPPIAVCRDTTEPTVRAISSWINDGRLIVDVGPARSGDPVVVLGDFNQLPYLGSWRLLRSRGLVDTYAASRRRPGPTWSPTRYLPAFARIDYVFAPSWFRPLDSWNLRLPGSDHRAVMTELEIPTGGSGDG
jgi:endonuclease/exonuclease/phosphatase (EEP) superfamily protein YafD